MAEKQGRREKIHKDSPVNNFIDLTNKNNPDQQYMDLLTAIEDYGITEPNTRTSTDIITLWDKNVGMTFDMRDEFPLINMRAVWNKGWIGELLWFLTGDEKVDFLHKHKIHYWDAWIDENNTAGPIYSQLVNWNNDRTLNQLDRAIDIIKEDPSSRQNVMTLWNASQISEMSVPPCPCQLQFKIVNEKLSARLYIRSSDTIVGLPFDMPIWATLTRMVAQITGYEPGNFHIVFGDPHIYCTKDNLGALEIMKTRTPGVSKPVLELNPDIKDIYKFGFDDVKVKDYNPHAAIPLKPIVGKDGRSYSR